METFQCESSKWDFPIDRQNCWVGVDLGSRTGKAVMLYRDMLYAALTPTGISANETGELLVGSLMKQSGVSRKQIRKMVGTGYGNVSLSLRDIPSDIMTEISCHAKGAHCLLTTARTVIDIGGQDAKAISIDERNGNVLEFILNDRCAAGTGRFLEKAAYLLEMPVERFSRISLQADSPCEISSQCVVFAESEIISLKASGSTAANIAAGVHIATARRIKNQTRRIQCFPDIFFSGGVSNNEGMKHAIESVLDKPVFSPEINAVYTGALGAAIYAAQ
ncbi:R-phenyllactate dehydratase activator [Pelotomaculum schinkii]|uniref:R-phenyllactate dehydratase activator n=1 Tax=Pelotomaculum schinkii TaxID=78350 RepID=A0A4Y7RHC7_9FIRM|nr:acyl-CoA dehydratase activase [Pelotomaculum schinkii]TEB08394.1 R-phenyllactate dehydratase activator [Pelotomaculum schinkii]